MLEEFEIDIVRYTGGCDACDRDVTWFGVSCLASPGVILPSRTYSTLLVGCRTCGWGEVEYRQLA